MGVCGCMIRGLEIMVRACVYMYWHVYTCARVTVSVCVEGGGGFVVVRV